MLENVSAFLVTDPRILFLQIVMVTSAFLIVYFVLFVTRDVIVRSQSFFFQIFCIILSSVPLIGFLIYLLIRPSTTIFERHLAKNVADLHRMMHQKTKQHEHKKDKHEKKKA